MSSIFSNLQVWEVLSNTWINLRAPSDGGSNRAIVLPKSSSAAVEKVLAVTALDDDKIELSYVASTALQGTQGEAGPAGAPGSDGANGNGLKFIGANGPSNAVNGDTWLRTLGAGASARNQMLQLVFDKWVHVERNVETAILTGITTSTVIQIPVPNGGESLDMGSLLASLQLVLHCFTGVNATNKWTVKVNTCFIGQWGFNNPTERFTFDLTDVTSGWGTAVGKNFYGDNQKVELLPNNYIEIQITKTGNPSPLWLHAKVATNGIAV